MQHQTGHWNPLPFKSVNTETPWVYDSLVPYLALYENSIILSKIFVPCKTLYSSFSTDLYSDILREEILSEYSMLIRVLAVWHAIIHAICSHGSVPNCKVA